VTAFLRLNGIAVPVLNDTATIEQEDVGSQHRAEDGTPIFNRRTTKRKWSLETTIQTAATALAFRDLVTGKGHVLNWEANNHYTSKGLAPTTVGANFTIAATAAKYGTYRAASAAAAANQATWTMFTPTSPWTIALWVSQDGGATWSHFVINSAAQKWLDGVRNDALFHPNVSVVGGVVTLGQLFFNNSFDDFVGFPQLMPLDWPPQLYAFGSPFGALAKLTADGLFIEQNARVDVKGAAGELKLFQGALPTHTANLHQFGFELLEV
jgi:hypothetical protein